MVMWLSVAFFATKQAMAAPKKLYLPPDVYQEESVACQDQGDVPGAGSYLSPWWWLLCSGRWAPSESQALLLPMRPCLAHCSQIINRQ